MCKVLNIPRSLVYYKHKKKTMDSELEKLIIKIFKDSKNNYGSRKIKVKLFESGYIVSLRRIRKIMNKYGLVSNYTIKQFKNHNSKVNNDNIPNIVDRNFNNRDLLEVVITDLTYVRVLNKWCFVCLIIDLFNREIIGYSAGRHKDALIVEKAIKSIKYNLNKVSIFHSDRGNEFKNNIIDEILNKFNIQRSLSKKGTPYDNAVAEATYKIFKTEFCFNRVFESFEQLELELFDYVNWFNNHRIHGSLDYLTPMQYKLVHI
jgi:transposase InsO family protein